MNPLIRLRGAFYLVLLLAVCAIPIALAQRNATKQSVAEFGSALSTPVSSRTLTFEERVSYQRAIEEVYWGHRIWPMERPGPKPSLDAVMSQAQLAKKVEDYLRNSQALEDYWQRPITAEQLQAEMDRMAQHTRQPEMLRELFAVLGNDPFVIAECLVRPVLSERMAANFYADDKEPLDLSQARPENQMPKLMAAASANYTLPTISDAPNGCIDNPWTATSTINAPTARARHTAVWTGSEMFVWGGFNSNGTPLNTGGRYNPGTDSWTATSTTNAPPARGLHTAVWSGSEMIVWGGQGTGIINFNTGGRYDPSTDTWAPTSTNDAPEARRFHTAVWTGSEMIVWGGVNQSGDVLRTGGRYNPSTDSWTATSITNAPSARFVHTAVWTGSEMIVWGGVSSPFVPPLNTGGRYDPSTNSWTATSTTDAPSGRAEHTAVWTDSEMIVWGGQGGGNTGGRYNPGTDSWKDTSTTNAPIGRRFHTAVWTGSEMIVWGGQGVDRVNTGGRYNPGTDHWTATSITNAPSARDLHTAVWTDSEMIVWGGGNLSMTFNTGGRYCPPRVTPRPRPTPHPRPSPP
jgi:hypothetical protein